MSFVLVHGGGFAGSCWDPLLPLLDAPVRAVDLPGRGSHPASLADVHIADFVDAVVDEIVGNDLHEVVLVGHSLAGVTLPGVADRIPDRLRRVVFVSCVVPSDGQSVIDVMQSLSPAVRAVAEQTAGEVTSGDGTLDARLAAAMFCNDMDDEQRAFTLAHLVPEAVQVITEAVSLAGFDQAVPRTYVRLLRDASIVLEVQDQMIDNLGAAEVSDLDAGHMAMISRPKKLAALLNAL
jgi:pimeloyl-ACP methyl ester carboxylesterase